MRRACRTARRPCFHIGNFFEPVAPVCFNSRVTPASATPSKNFLRQPEFLAATVITLAIAGFHFYFLLHGVAQHNLYHAGQIAILKRAL